MKRTLFAPLVLVLALAAQPVAAQVCVGAPSLQGARSANVGFGADFLDGGTDYVGSFVTGSEWQFGGSFGYTDFDDTDTSLKSVTGQVAWEREQASGLAYCPSVQASYGFGLEVAGIDFTSWALAPGFSVGYETQVSDIVSLVPSGTGRFVYESVNADGGVAGEVDVSDTYGVLSATLGILFNDVFQVGPVISFPVGRDDEDAQFGVTLILGIGG